MPIVSDTVPAFSVLFDDYCWTHSRRRNPTLRSLSFTIRPGERVLVVGPSGSGKSTLLSAIAGMLGEEDEGYEHGTLRVNGTVGMVIQDPDAQIISGTCADELAFGMENYGVDPRSMDDRSARACALVGLDYFPERSTESLSGGQKQRLALAGIIAYEPDVVLLDEPTAMIDPCGVKALRTAVETMYAAKKSTVIIVEHRTDIWADFCDRMIVLHDIQDESADEGEISSILIDGPIHDVIKNHAHTLKEMGVWLPEELSSARPHDVQQLSDAADQVIAVTTHQLLTAWPEENRRHTERKHKRRDDTVNDPGRTLAIPAHKTTVITGANGVGKTRLLLTLAGLLMPRSGSVHYNTDLLLPVWDEEQKNKYKKVQKKRYFSVLHEEPYMWPSRTLAHVVGVVFQNPEHQFLTRTVREELLLHARVTGADHHAPAWKRAQERADDVLHRLRLENVANVNPFTLSGGQQRRLSVATALVLSPPVLLLDEPTFGQDRTTFCELVALLKECAEQGTTIIAATHDQQFIDDIADYELCLSESM